MKILAHIDQGAALKAGINATSSTAELEFDPAALTQEQRDLLAQFMQHDGYKTNERAVISNITGQLKLTQPTQADLIKKLESILDEINKVKSDRIATAKKKAAEYENIMSNLIAEPNFKSFEVRIKDGKFDHDLMDEYQSGHTSIYKKSDKLAHLPELDYFVRDKSAMQYINADLISEYESLRDKYLQQAIAALDAIEPGLRAELAEKERAEQAKVDDYKALYARLPEILRRKDAAGVTKRGEIDHAIKKLICADAGLGYFPVFSFYSCDSATDDEFSTFESIDVPDGWEKELLTVFDGYRAADEDDDTDDIDSEGDVRINERNVAVLSTQRAGIETKTIVEL